MNHPTVNSIADIASELLHRYHEIMPYLKKGEKGSVFKKILKDLFISHGERFGFFDNFHEFKSSVVRVMYNMKKKSNKYFDEEKVEEPSELSGIEFTLWQIENLELNPDSY